MQSQRDVPQADEPELQLRRLVRCSRLNQLEEREPEHDRPQVRMLPLRRLALLRPLVAPL